MVGRSLGSVGEAQFTQTKWWLHGSDQPFSATFLSLTVIG